MITTINGIEVELDQEATAGICMVLKGQYERHEDKLSDQPMAEKTQIMREAMRVYDCVCSIEQAEFERFKNSLPEGSLTIERVANDEGYLISPLLAEGALSLCGVELPKTAQVRWGGTPPKLVKELGLFKVLIDYLGQTASVDVWVVPAPMSLN